MNIELATHAQIATRTTDGLTSGGADFRYPVTVDGHGKFRGRIDDLGLEPEALGDIYYKFGANEMHIGYGIKHVLEELENLYGLDFVELEVERKAKLKK